MRIKTFKRKITTPYVSGETIAEIKITVGRPNELVVHTIATADCPPTEAIPLPDTISPRGYKGRGFTLFQRPAANGWYPIDASDGGEHNLLHEPDLPMNHWLGLVKYTPRS